jgi:hypothetical protein
VAKSPTSRTLEECRKRGWTAQKVEWWNAYAKIRIDLFGIIDIVVLDDAPGLLGIQATTSDNISARLAKIAESKEAKLWLERGLRLEVWGWAKRGPRGKRKLWTLDRRPVLL